MSEPTSPLQGQSYEGFAQIREIGPLGMITLRCDLSLKTLATMLKSLGLTVPAPRQLVQNNERTVGWMSHDELLLILPYSEVSDALITIRKALAKIHFLAEDVSDARAVFRVEGELAEQVLAKLCPVDMQSLAQNELRRTRLAQVAAAFWVDQTGYTVVSFRSVAGYVMGLLKNAAQPGSEI
jgi:sarcosine oxidase subunit gamma